MSFADNGRSRDSLCTTAPQRSAAINGVKRNQDDGGWKFDGYHGSTNGGTGKPQQKHEQAARTLIPALILLVF